MISYCTLNSGSYIALTYYQDRQWSEEPDEHHVRSLAHSRAGCGLRVTPQMNKHVIKWIAHITFSNSGFPLKLVFYFPSVSNLA